MPQIAAWAAAAAYTAVGAYTTAGIIAYVATYIVVTVAITYGLNTLAQSLAGKPKRDDVGTQSRDVTVKGTVEPQQLIYGEARTGGFVAFYGVGGANNRYLYFVIVVAGHQCEDITDVWLDGRMVADADIGALGVVSTAEFQDGGYRLRVIRHLGEHGQTADADLVAAFPSEWTTNHRGAGVAYALFVLDKSEKAYPTGAPNSFFCLVKGRRLYDPRLDSTNGGSGTHRFNDATTWAWSRNAALVRRDYISGGSKWYDVTTPEKRMAFGEADARINDAILIASANICDEAVTIPNGSGGSTTQPRYTCDVQLSCSNTHRENMEILNSADVGTTTYVNGQYRIYSGAYDTPAITIGEDDIIGPVTVSTHPNGEELYNFVTGTFYDELRDWSLSPFPNITNSSYETEDRGQKPRKIELHATRTSYRAQRIAILHLAQSRNKITVRFERLSPKAMAIALHETFNVTISEYGWSNKVFRCREWEWMPDGFIALTAREESSAAYADPSVGTYADAEEATVATPEYDEPDTPTNFTATAMAEGIFFRWQMPAPRNTRTIFRLYRHTASTPFSSAVEVWTGTTDGIYIERPGQTVEYYWIVAELNGIQSAATPVGAGLAAAPFIQGFEEAFQDSFEHQDYARFYNLRVGTPTATYPTNGENGGRVLRFENYGWIASNRNIPYDPTQTYLMTVRARMVTAPTGGVSTQDLFYAGVEGIAADGTTLIDNSGGSSISGFYCAAAGFDFGGVTLGDWVTFRGYISGLIGSVESAPSPDINDPMALWTGVRFIRPLVILNYNGGNGIMEVDYIKIERVVLTRQIGPDAVSDLADQLNAGPVVSSHNNTSVDVDTLSMTPTDDGDLTVTISFDALWNGNGTTSRAAIQVRDSGTPISGNSSESPIDTAQTRGYILRGTFPVTAGASIVIALRSKHTGNPAPLTADTTFSDIIIERLLRKK